MTLGTLDMEPKTIKTKFTPVNGEAKPCSSALTDKMRQTRDWIAVLVKLQKIGPGVGERAVKMIDEALRHAREGRWDGAVNTFLAAYGLIIEQKEF